MEPPTTIVDALRRGEALLAASSDTPRLDASVLLRHAGGWTAADLIARAGEPLPEAAAERYRRLLGERRAGRPVAHLVGRREFWSLELGVDARVLIPRPETELLVEAALALIPAEAEWSIADLGTGSGAVALALALERPRCRVTATDVSAGAIEVAEGNRRTLGLTNVELLQGDWFEPLAGRRFRLLAANPPYVAAGDPHLSWGDLRFEPGGALVAGADGLDEIRRIVAGAGNHLESCGRLLLEHGWSQGEAVRRLLGDAGFEAVETLRDLAGLPRVTRGRVPR